MKALPHKIMKRGNFKKDQRGAVTVMAALFLIVVISLMLNSALDMSGSNVMDSALQDDSVAALQLAESGIERASWKLVNGATCDSTLAEGPVSFGNGSFTINDLGASFNTDFSGAALASSQCHIQINGIANSATRTIEAIVTFESNLLSGANPDFNAPEAAPGPPTGWTLSNSGDVSGDPWDDTGGPDGSRSAYLYKPSNGPSAATAAGQFTFTPFTISVPVTLTLTFDYKVNVIGPGGSPQEMQVDFSLIDDATNTYNASPSPYKDGDTGGYTSGSVTFTIPDPGGGSITMESLTFDLLGKAGKAKEIWLDNLVLTGGGGGGGLGVIKWREN